MLRPAPYPTVLKPYGSALVELARKREDVVCLGADLTRQTETDLFRDEFPDRFFNVGMAEANLMGIAAGMARAGLTPFVNTFGVFCTRRPYDQVAMSIAYPALPVRLAGFMPGLSSPGGPSHQAIDDVALMRALPNMTILDIGDAGETRQAVEAVADVPGPVYLRLKRGEIPQIFDDTYRFRLDRACIVRPPGDVAVVASGMMLPAAIKAVDAAAGVGIAAAVVYVPVIKPLDAATVISAIAGAAGVVTAENHSIVGGLGSAVAEILAEGGSAVPLRRVGVADRFAEPGSRPYLFGKYGLSSANILRHIWELAGQSGQPPGIEPVEREEAGSFEPV
jgi:transketolase